MNAKERQDFVKQKIVHKYYLGTTCCRYVSVEREYKNYALLHHHSHAEYVDRVTDTVTCEAYHVLVKKDENVKGWLFYAKRHGILFIRGRMNKIRWEMVATKLKDLGEDPNHVVPDRD